MTNTFYQGLNIASKFIEILCNAEFFRKDVDETREYLDSLAKSSYVWKKYNTSERNQPLYLIKVGEDEDIARKLITLPKKVEDLLSKRLEIVRVINEVQEIRDNCEIQGFIIRIVQLFLPSKKYEMNKLMSSSLVRNQQIIHIHQHSTLVGRII